MFWDVLYVFLGNIFVRFWIACYNLFGQHVCVILDILPVFGQHVCVFFGYFTCPFLGAIRLCVLEYFVCGNAILGNMFMCFFIFPLWQCFWASMLCVLGHFACGSDLLPTFLCVLRYLNVAMFSDNMFVCFACGNVF